jgi:hypothetical protein
VRQATALASTAELAAGYALDSLLTIAVAPMAHGNRRAARITGVGGGR